jgi:hypothetical protein
MVSVTDSPFFDLICYNLNIPFMAIIYCRKCGELNYLSPHCIWNISDFAKCEIRNTINTITLETCGPTSAASISIMLISYIPKLN